MAPSTAVLFVLCGTAVSILAGIPQSTRGRRASLVIAGMGAAVSVPLFFLSTLGIHPAIERLGMQVPKMSVAMPIGHISPLTAACFAFVSVALVLHSSSWCRRHWHSALTLSLGSIVTLIGAVLILGYMAGIPLLYGSPFIPPALPTSLALLFLGLALLLLLSQRFRVPDVQSPADFRQGFPMRTFIAGILTTLIPFILGIWAMSTLEGELHRVSSTELHLEELNGRILRLDEVLTMSAIAAAATGDLYWEERYQQHEPELDSLLNAAMAISPTDSPGNGVAATDAANLQLVRIEHEAFAFVHAGKRTGALELLNGKEYRNLKAAYSAGIGGEMSRMRTEVNEQRTHFNKMSDAVLLIQLIALLPIVLVWLRIVTLVNLYIQARDGSERAMRDLNESLEDRVVERTARLEEAIEDARREMEVRLAFEQQLRQAQKLEAVGSLAAGIAHEINTPVQFVGDNVRFLSNAFGDLTALLARSNELVRSLPSSPELQTFVREFTAAQDSAELEYLMQEVPRTVEQTLDGVARVARIVRAMKDFSHPDQGEKQSADLNRALQSTMTVANNELKYVADIVTDFEDDLPAVFCHLSDLNQVFLNLLVNAAHAIAGKVGDGSDEKGTITVRTRRSLSPQDSTKTEGVTITVSDTGTGIPQEIRERVFDHFFTTKEVGKGTGQGLAIARAVVVDKHGGRIWFETEPGKGTTFHVYIPLGAEEVAESKELVS